MKLTANDLRTTYWIVARWRRAEIMAGRPIERPVAALMERLDREIRWAVSPSRHEIDSAAGELKAEHTVELIGTKLAAQILGWSERKVQRHRSDLGGRCVVGRLVFNAKTVRHYKEQMEDL
jgi:hypothetical protein